MNKWLQAKQFTCPKCGASYVHDKAYAHQLFQCLKRERSASGESCGRHELGH